MLRRIYSLACLSSLRNQFFDWNVQVTGAFSAKYWNLFLIPFNSFFEDVDKDGREKMKPGWLRGKKIVNIPTTGQSIPPGSGQIGRRPAISRRRARRAGERSPRWHMNNWTAYLANSYGEWTVPVFRVFCPSHRLPPFLPFPSRGHLIHIFSALPRPYPTRAAYPAPISFASDILSFCRAGPSSVPWNATVTRWRKMWNDSIFGCHIMGRAVHSSS